jgi:TonB family protein
MKKMKRMIFSMFLLLLMPLLGIVAHSNSTFEDSPKVIKAVAPKNYPPLAAAARIGGKVKVEVKIDAEGNVASAKIIEGHPLLKDISKSTALRWKFVPSQENDKERTAQLTFTFTPWSERKEEERGVTTFLPPYEIEIVGGTVTLERESVH